jgi:hypothetical protein
MSDRPGRHAPGGGLLRLYPRAWRQRYEEEVRSVLEDATTGLRGRVDLARGALDAWLHPPRRSRAPGLLALAGGALWALVALDVLRQPAPPDWPGYLAESLPVALIAVVTLGGAIIGAWLGFGDEAGRLGVVAVDVAVAGYLAWAVALVAAIVGIEYGATTAIAQTVAAGGTILVGLVGLRAGKAGLGLAIVVAGSGLIVPSALGWLLTGGAWLAVGALELRDRPDPIGPQPIAA